MNEVFKKEVAQFMYPYYGNNNYNNINYYNELVKTYGKKEVIKMMDFISHNGGITNAFSST